jgi:hypothetical protein
MFGIYPPYRKNRVLKKSKNELSYWLSKKLCKTYYCSRIVHELFTDCSRIVHELFIPLRIELVIFLIRVNMEISRTVKKESKLLIINKLQKKIRIVQTFVHQLFALTKNYKFKKLCVIPWTIPWTIDEQSLNNWWTIPEQSPLFT